MHREGMPQVMQPRPAPPSPVGNPTAPQELAEGVIHGQTVVRAGAEGREESGVSGSNGSPFLGEDTLQLLQAAQGRPMERREGGGRVKWQSSRPRPAPQRSCPCPNTGETPCEPSSPLPHSWEVP